MLPGRPGIFGPTDTPGKLGMPTSSIGLSKSISGALAAPEYTNSGLWCFISTTVISGVLYAFFLIITYFNYQLSIINYQLLYDHQFSVHDIHTGLCWLTVHSNTVQCPPSVSHLFLGNCLHGLNSSYVLIGGFNDTVPSD